MTLTCVNPGCGSSLITRNGWYYRASDRKNVQRLKCSRCGTGFSMATGQKTYRQNKRHLNDIILRLLASGMSIRRIAILLNIHRTTVARKLAFLAEIATEKQELYWSSRPKVTHVQFDELITIEHSKYKPLAVSVAVENDTRQLLGAEVSIIPASGPLAEVSRRKYGRRPDLRKKGISSLYGRISDYVIENPVFSTDEDTRYPGLIKKYFPGADHKKYKSAEARERGLGELKKGAFDPLFPVNHTLAMLRANINRLFRKTWCTTKKKERLAQHLAVYMYFHNTVLTKYPA